MAKSSSDNKKVQGPPLTKAVSTDEATLKANANVDATTGADNSRRAVCYNRACRDYRVERPAHQPCGCRRRTIAAT